jgi:hypothetical protein
VGSCWKARLKSCVWRAQVDDTRGRLLRLEITKNGQNPRFISFFPQPRRSKVRVEVGRTVPIFREPQSGGPVTFISRKNLKSVAQSAWSKQEFHTNAGVRAAVLYQWFADLLFADCPG